MVQKPFDWEGYIELPDHSRRKHKVVREYFENYLRARCPFPYQRRFSLAIVDGFAGAGLYSCGSPGSPLIFLETLRKFVTEKNVEREGMGMPPLQVDCQLILNDLNQEAVRILQHNVAPIIEDIRATEPNLMVVDSYHSKPFEEAYSPIAQQLEREGVQNVLFNLDQAGHSLVRRATIDDIMRRFRKAEIFYTFFIQPLLTFLQRNNPANLRRQLSALDLQESVVSQLDCIASTNEWLGCAEKLVFDEFRSSAPFVSPFSIKKPDGWRYWLIHFANEDRARQVYNDVLHGNSTLQAHFGRAGLDMLSFDPSHQEAQLYLFDQQGQDRAMAQLIDDIPKLLSGSGDVMRVGEFYRLAYNMTPAHSDDIHRAIQENPDLEVRTETGGTRRKAERISRSDHLILKPQTSFFPRFRRS